MDTTSTKDRLIYEDKEVFAVLAATPIAKGHVIVGLKEPYKALDELPDFLLHKLVQLAQACVKALKSNYSPKGYSILQNGGTLNNTDQFQLHIFPRNNREDFSWTYQEDVEAEAKGLTVIKHILEQKFQKLYKP